MAKGDSWSTETYHATRRETIDRGVSVTHEAEKRFQSGLGLDPSVDPKTHGATRESVDSLKEQPDGKYLLTHGIAMPVKTDGDLTGSMGGNIDEFFRILPKTQKYLVGPNGLLGRYDVHFCTGGIQDKVDNNPYMVSEFERDNLIDAQMAKIIPERWGGDSTEDYQLGLFFTGERVKASIWRYGLKGYYFIVGDEIGRDSVDSGLVKRVFGLDVQEIPTKDLARKVLEKWHVFYLQVGSNSYTTEWWSDILGANRVVKLPNIEYLAEVQASIIGLTEGVLDIQSLENYLIGTADIPRMARQIVNAVRSIPIDSHPLFTKIPLAGTVVTNREELYPDTAVYTPTTAASGSSVGEIDLRL